VRDLQIEAKRQQTEASKAMIELDSKIKEMGETQK
jgi:hypothetical protein